MIDCAPHIAALQPYEPGTPIEEAQRKYGLTQVIKLASNESAYGASPLVLQALSAYAGDIHRYPDPRGYDARHAIAAHQRVTPEEVVLGSGSNELIDLACRVFTKPGEHAVFGKPSFPSYRIAAVAAQLRITEVELRERVHWNIDDLLAAITPDTRIVFIDSPNNPTGSYLPERDVRRLLEHASPNTLVVMDEAYVEYADAVDYSSALEMRSSFPNLLVLRTFSKAFGLAALRVGYGIAHPSVVANLQKLRAPFNVNALAQFAACRALDDLDFVNDAARRVREERTRLAHALTALKLKVAPSQANFLLVQVPHDGRTLTEQLMQRGIIVRPMTAPITDFIRISVGKPEENEACLQQLAALLK